jgi:hypothetical protein
MMPTLAAICVAGTNAAGTTASSGAAGDVNPPMSNEIHYPDPQPGRMVEYMLPGYVLEALEKHALEMFERIGT